MNPNDNSQGSEWITPVTNLAPKIPTIEEDLAAAEERKNRLAKYPEGAETALAADSLIKAIEENKEPVQGPQRIVVVAKDAKEMGVAQKQLIVWVDAKMTELKIELKEAEDNLALFTKNKWRTSSSKTAVSKAKKLFEYYEKMKAALEAGYVIIPNMPDQAYDVFAVRTTAKNPRGNHTKERWGSVKDQATTSPPVGEGRYVSPDAVENQESIVLKHETGKNPEMGLLRWAEEFQDIAFPFKMAKPQVIEETALAMKLNIFDELVASPKFRRSKVKGDPMVMGRIMIKHGFHVKAVTFLITWFVDTKDL